MARAVLRVCLVPACTLLLMAAGVEAQSGRGRAHAAANSEKDDKDARDLFRLGKQAFDELRFERALKYFKDAYELSHRPALLSNIGTALDRLRRDQEALEAYESYLAQVPNAPNRALIEERVQLIRAALDKAKEPEPAQLAAAETVPSPSETARAAQPTQTAPDGATRASAGSTTSSSGAITSHWWFWAGVGVLAAGAVTIGVAASAAKAPGVQEPALVSAATRVREL